MEKKTRGRQKIEIKKIEKKNDLQVAFSKRRNGLFKKASELGTLCNAEVAMVLFSPGGKAYSFGHPGVNPVADRFLLQHPPPRFSNSSLSLVEAPRNPKIDELNKELENVLNQLEAEKKYGKKLEEMRTISQVQRGWEAPVEELTLDQLEQQRVALLNLRNNVTKQVEMLNNGVGTSATPWPIIEYSGYPQAEMVNGIGTATAAWPVQDYGGYPQTEKVNGNGSAADPWPLLENSGFQQAGSVNGMDTTAAPWYQLQDYSGNPLAEMVNGNGTSAAPWPLQAYSGAETVNGIGTGAAPWPLQEYGGNQAGSVDGIGTAGAQWSSQEYGGYPLGHGHGLF